MKKLLLLALLTPSAFAATTGTLLLQGIVPRVVSVVVTPQPIASALDLTSTQIDLNVASVNEKSNSNTGYKMTITSANLGKLKRVGGTEVMSYTMKYNGSAVTLTAPSVTTYSTVAIYNSNKAITISYTGVPSESMLEGTYNDTITFTIAAN